MIKVKRPSLMQPPSIGIILTFDLKYWTEGNKTILESYVHGRNSRFS